MNRIILISFAVLWWLSGRAQHAVFIHSGKVTHFDVHRGYLRYPTGAIVSGFFVYADMEFPTYSVKRVDSATRKTKQRIFMKDIDRMVLVGHDSALTRNDSTYFRKFSGREKLFRQLTFGDIQIFDNLFSVNENPGRVGTQFMILHGATTIYVGNKSQLGAAVNKLLPAGHTTGNDPKKIIERLNGEK